MHFYAITFSGHSECFSEIRLFHYFHRISGPILLSFLCAYKDLSMLDKEYSVFMLGKTPQTAGEWCRKIWNLSNHWSVLLLIIHQINSNECIQKRNSLLFSNFIFFISLSLHVSTAVFIKSICAICSTLFKKNFAYWLS